MVRGQQTVARIEATADGLVKMYSSLACDYPAGEVTYTTD